MNTRGDEERSKPFTGIGGTTVAGLREAETGGVRSAHVAATAPVEGARLAAGG